MRSQEEWTPSGYLLSVLASLAATGDAEMFVEKVDTYPGPGGEDLRKLIQMDPVLAGAYETMKMNKIEKIDFFLKEQER